jgi:hypothetical protein
VAQKEVHPCLAQQALLVIQFTVWARPAGLIDDPDLPLPGPPAKPERQPLTVGLSEVPAFGALSQTEQRAVYNALINSALEGYLFDEVAVTDLCEFVSGTISSAEHQDRALARAASKRRSTGEASGSNYSG